MTRRMTEADWMAVARVFFNIHQRRAARQETGNGQARRTRAGRRPVRAPALPRTGDGDHDGPA